MQKKRAHIHQVNQQVISNVFELRNQNW